MKFKQLTELGSSSGAGPGARHDAFVHDVPESRTVPKAGLIGHIDPQGAGLFHHEYLMQNGSYTLPPSGCANLTQGRIVGTRTFLWQDSFSNDTLYVNDQEKKNHITCLANSGSDSWLNEDTGISQNTENDDSYDIDFGKKERKSISGQVAFIGSHEFSNWGSFLFRVLPKMAVLKRLFLDDVNVMANIHYQNYRLLLNIAGVRDDKIIHHDRTAIYSVEDLMVPTLPSPHVFFPPEVVGFYNQISRSVTTRKPFRKLYISRMSEAARNYRTLLNEGELAGRLEAVGFEIVNPAELPIREQIRIFAEAAVVVGPSGSGMFNVVFCQPGTLVFDIESARDWIYAHTNMFSSLGHSFAIIEGLSDRNDPRPTHKNWSVDVEAAMTLIRSHL
ncbi:glycosyltransferase family 61 protein [Azospirillum doebereinerae]